MGGLRSEPIVMTLNRDYLRAFVPLAILFALYNFSFAWWLDQSTSTTVKRWETPTLAKNQKWWEGFFKDDAWQRNGPQSLETASAILLYKSREELSDRRWKIKPLTIVIPQGNDSTGKSRRAVFIENPEGAEIQFQKRPEWNAPPPPLETGILLGKTLIYSPPESPEGGDGLQIETSEIRIENLKIWTDKAIKMKMADSSIEGRHLTILLAQKLLSTDQPKGDVSPFQGLNSMELFYVDKVRVGLKPGGLWPSQSISDATNRPAHAQLKCGGRFEFKFLQREAVLYGGVKMEHHVQGLPIDTFDCEELHLRVGFRSTGQAAPSGIAQQGTPWTVEELTAYGAMGRESNDYSRWLKLNAPGMQAEAHGLMLFMDFVEGRVELRNSLPMTMAKDSSRVYLRREGLRIWCPEVQYHNPQIVSGLINRADTKEAPRLGLVHARGPGTAQLESETEPWTISWGNNLQVRPDRDGEKDVITLDGSASVSNRTEGHFSADHLDFWLHPVRDELRKQLQPYYQNKRVPQWLPDRMQADRNVQIESPTINARVDSMKIAFVYPSSPLEPDQANTSAVSETNTVNASLEQLTSQNQSSIPNPVAASSMPGDGRSTPLRQPSLPTHSLSSSTLPNQTKTLSPFDVRSKSLEAVIRNTGGEASVHTLHVQGDFTVQRNQLSQSAPWVFEAKGELFRLQRTSSDLANVHLVGTPAKIGLGSGWFEAPEFSFSQTEHAFWIDHPGELVLPTEAIPLGPALAPSPNLVSTGPTTPNALQGFRPITAQNTSNPMKWLEAPRLKWNDRMVFDGKKAMFGGGISLNCKIEASPNILWHVALNASSLGIEMVNPVPLDSKNLATFPRAEIATIRFENDVDINAFQTDRDLNRISREHIKLPRLDVYVPGQTMKGFGPGEFWTRRFGGTNPMASLGPTGPGRPKDQTKDLQCMHLSFIGGLEGDYRTKTISFGDRVEALMGPIANWEQELNVQHADRLGPHQTHLIADRIDLFDSSDLSWNRNQPGRTSKNVWEVKAVQRVTVRTQTDKGLVAASGDELKYDSGTDTVRISGAPQKATILFPNPNDPASPSTLNVGTFAMQLKTGNMEMTLSSFEGQLPSSMQRAGTNPAPQPANNGMVLPSPRSFPNRP